MTTTSLISLAITLKDVVLDADAPLDMRHEAQSSLREVLAELARRARFDGQARQFIDTWPVIVTSLLREGEHHERIRSTSSGCPSC